MPGAAASSVPTSRARVAARSAAAAPSSGGAEKGSTATEPASTTTPLGRRSAGFDAGAAAAILAASPALGVLGMASGPAVRAGACASRASQIVATPASTAAAAAAIHFRRYGARWTRAPPCASAVASSYAQPSSGSSARPRAISTAAEQRSSAGSCSAPRSSHAIRRAAVTSSGARASIATYHSAAVAGSPLRRIRSSLIRLAPRGALADPEPPRDLLVAELGGGAQQEHLAAARLELEQRALDDLDALLERDDALGRGLVRGQVRERRVVAVRPARAALAETVVREVGRDLEDQRAHAARLDRLDLHQTQIGFLHQVLGLVAPRQEIREVAEQRHSKALEHPRDEVALLPRTVRRRLWLLGHPLDGSAALPAFGYHATNTFERHGSAIISAAGAEGNGARPAELLSWRPRSATQAGLVIDSRPPPPPPGPRRRLEAHVRPAALEHGSLREVPRASDPERRDGFRARHDLRRRARVHRVARRGPASSEDPETALARAALAVGHREHVLLVLRAHADSARGVLGDRIHRTAVH